MKKVSKLMGAFLLAGILVFTGCQNNTQKLEDKVDQLEDKVDDTYDDKDDRDDLDDDQDDMDDVDDLEKDKDVTTSNNAETEEVLAAVRSFAVDAAGEITGPATRDYSAISENSKDLVTVLEHRNAFLQSKLEREGNLDVPVDDLDLDIEQIIVVNDEAFVEAELEVELTNDYDRDEDYFILLEKENGEWKVVNYVSEDDIYIEKYYEEASVAKARQLKDELKMDDHKRNVDEIMSLLREIKYDVTDSNLENIQKTYQ